MEKHLDLKTTNWDAWRFRCPITDDNKLPLDGLILEAVQHSNWWLAENIRVVGVHINPSFYKQEYKYLRLNDSSLPCITPLEKIEVTAPGAPPDFASDKLKVLSGLRAVYETPEPVVTDGSKLKITQTYLFTPYSDNPAHEPSGLLHAARLYPLLKIEYPEDDKVYSIRIDYRLALKLDQLERKTSVLSLPISPSIQNVMRASRSFKNQAGIFRDDDELNSQIFIAAEKPLVAEIVSYGLNPGLIDNIMRRHPETWDNIHWWNKTDGFPSTPGAFHAAHLHWRWGKILQKSWGKTPLPLNYAGAPQFVSKIYEGGALLDPNIPIQVINFAVARKKEERNLAVNMLRQFKDFFNTDSTKPEQISGKDEKTKKAIEVNDLCLWFSVEVFSSSLFKNYSEKINPKGINGSVFTHGLFFAHESEEGFFSKLFSKEPLTSLFNTSENYINPKKPDKNQWVRVPKIS